MSDFLNNVIMAHPDEHDLAYLSKLCNDLSSVRFEIEKMEDNIKQLKEAEQNLSSVVIPEFFQSKGVSAITLESGQKIEITEDLFVSIPKTNELDAKVYFDFIKDNGGEAIIKEETTISNCDLSTKTYLHQVGVEFQDKKDVNTNTLKAWFKDILGMKNNSIAKVELSELPKEIKIFISKKTKIK